MQKALHHFLTLLFLVVISGSIRANNPPANDSVNNAINLGLLPIPGPCPNNPDGDTISLSGTTDFATFNPADFSITHCFTNGSPDVWYRMRIPASHLQFDAVGLNGLNNFFAKLYHSQGSSLSLVPLECVTSNFGVISYSFPTPDINGEYYLEIGGSNPTQTGNFYLRMKCYEDCNGCVKHGNVVLDPAPTFGRYNIGDTVSMCTTVSHWEALSSSYLHGIVPLFADDWDTLSIIATQAPSSPNNTNGWHWFTGVATPCGTHSGFFYDGNNDGDPSNNAGDNGNILTSWTGCWKIKTKPQCITNDLSIDVHIYSDNETGNGNGLFICDPYDIIHISTGMNCCLSPQVSIVYPSSCITGSTTINVMAGSSTASTDLCDYFLLDTGLNIIQQIVNHIGPCSFFGVAPGQYIVRVLDHTTGSCSSFVTVNVNPSMVLNVHQTVINCSQGNASAIVDVVSGGSGQYTYNWNVSATMQNDSLAFGLPDGWITVSVSDMNSGCNAIDSVNIISEPSPDATFDLPDNPICISADTVTLVSQPPSPGGTFNLLSPLTGGITIDAATGEIFLNNTTLSTPFYVYEKYSVGINCQSAFIDSVLIVGLPAAPIATSAASFIYCIGSTPPVFSVTVPGSSLPIWYDVQTNNTGIGNNFTPPLNASTTPGNYFYSVSSLSTLAGSCLSTPTIFIVAAVLPPSVTAGNDTSICIGETADLVSGNCNCSYFWNPPPTIGQTNSNNSLTSPAATTTYTVTATDQNGCSASAFQTVSIDPSGLCHLQVYHGITPNGDGHNDAWIIDGINNTDDISVTIFNRWGEKVWNGDHYNNVSIVWHGEDRSGNALPDATYFYILTSDNYHLRGWVELSH